MSDIDFSSIDPKNLNAHEMLALMAMYQDHLDAVGHMEDIMAQWLAMNDRDQFTAGDVTVARAEGGKTYDNHAAAQKVLDTLEPEQVADILEKATPEPKVSWSKVVTALKIKRADIPFTQKDDQAVITVEGKKVRTMDWPGVDTDDLEDVVMEDGSGRAWSMKPMFKGDGSVPAPRDLSVPPGEQEPDYDAAHGVSDEDIPF